MLTPTLFVSFFTDEAYFTRDGVNNTRNSYLWHLDNPHGMSKATTINVWCGVIADQVTGPHSVWQRLTADISANCLQHELSAVLENVPLQTRSQMYYQHDGAPPHFSQVVRQYLNQQFENQWIGFAGAKNWPPWSPDLDPLEYHVWGYMPAVVYARKVNTREELLQRVLSAARCIDNGAVFLKVTSSQISAISAHCNAFKDNFDCYLLEEMKNCQQTNWIAHAIPSDMTTGISTRAVEELVELSEDTSLKMNFN